MHLRTLQKIWRTGLWLFMFGLVGWLGYRYYGVNGEFTVRYDFSHQPNLISEFSPSGRALAREQNTANGEFYQRVISDPVYFSVQLPSAYPQATVQIEYQNPEQAIVQLGLRLTDETVGWNFDFQTLENSFIDKSNFERIENADYVLLQRTSRYASIENFLAQPPIDSQVGTWQVGTDLPFIDPTYAAEPTGTIIDATLRGQHELMTYIKNEPLELTVKYQDINYSAGPDPLTIEIYFLGDLISTQPFADDGEEGVTGKTRSEQIAEIKLDNLPEGVYKIVLRASDDLIIKQIQSAQHKLVFKTKLHLAGSEEYRAAIPDINLTPATVYTDADSVTVQAKHLYGLGKVQFFDGALDINQVDDVFSWHNPIWRYLAPIKLSYNDVEIIADGYLALNEASWFDPSFGFRQLTQYTRGDQLDYIISRRYTEPQRLRNWITATATYDLTRANRTDPTRLDFIVSAPGLNETPQGLKVRTIQITARKETLTWKNLWPRLKAKLRS